MEWLTTAIRGLDLITKVMRTRLFDKLLRRAAVAQKVRWGPNDGLGPGMRVWDEGGYEQFMGWEELKREFRAKLLPQTLRNSSGFDVAKRPHDGKDNWLVDLIDPEGQPLCAVWIGVDPDSGWQFDGLIRFGGEKPPHVWQIYQRYSDGSYRRVASRYRTLEAARDQPSTRSGATHNI